MGTWGAENFENDGANDYLVRLIEKLITEIETDFSDEHLAGESFLEDYGEFHIIPAIDIFTTLSVTYDVPARVDSKTAARWRQNYLKAYDRTNSMYWGEFILERRKVIEETFDRLDNLIADWEESQK